MNYDDMARVLAAFGIPYVKAAFRGPYVAAVQWAIDHAADPAEVDEGKERHVVSPCVCAPSLSHSSPPPPEA